MLVLQWNNTVCSVDLYQTKSKELCHVYQKSFKAIPATLLSLSGPYQGNYGITLVMILTPAYKIYCYEALTLTLARML